MTCWVGISNGIIVCITVVIQSLHAGWDDTVRLGKSPQRDIVPARVVKHQAEVCGVAELTGEPVLRRRDSALVAHFTPGFVPQGCFAIPRLGYDCPCGIGHKTGGAKVIGEQVEKFSMPFG